MPVSASELRSGNIVQGREFHHYRLDMHSDGITKLTAYGIYLIEDGKISFEPVKLTKDIFKKMDVAESSDGWYSFMHEGFDFNMHTGTLIFEIGSDEIREINKKPIYHLHELQNAYYFLTGRELEYRL